MVFHQNETNNASDNHPKLLADNLTFLLKQHHVTTTQLAQRLGIPMMTIRRLLSGETEDPRISTLKIIADYFKISIDHLLSEDPRHILSSVKPIKYYLIPKIDWESLPKLSEIEALDFTNWSEWQSIAINNNHPISKSTFAVESRPSMYQRFPKGTLFIIDPTASPTDGDIVLLQLKENHEFTLRELIIDPPDWRLAPLVNDSSTFDYSKDQHKIIGVSLLIMRYHPKLTN